MLNQLNQIVELKGEIIVEKKKNCKHENKETMTIGGVTFTRITLCKDCRKILDRSDK